MADRIASDALVKILLWLFPVVYLLHIAEEYWVGGGFSAYVTRTRGVNLSSAKFLVLNGIGWGLTLLGVSLARRLGFSEWLLACLATVIFLNGLSHAIITLLSAEYNPGFATGLLIFIPGGAAILIYLKSRMRGPRYVGALAVGLCIHGVISLLAVTGGRLAPLAR